MDPVLPLTSLHTSVLCQSSNCLIEAVVVPHLVTSPSASLTAGLSLRSDHQRHSQGICCALAELGFWIVDRIEDMLKELLDTLHI